jgi:DNA-binding NtrC family response regulator
MPLRVYYLDDEPDLLELFVDTFSTPEIEITPFHEAKNVLEAIRISPPDLVVLDYRLPNVNGDQIAAQIDSRIPRALITGDIQVKVESRFDAIFEKPYSTELVKKFLASFLGKGNKAL